MKTVVMRQRKTVLEDQLLAEPYDKERVTLKYFPAMFPPGASEALRTDGRLTVPIDLLDAFCRVWLTDRAREKDGGLMIDPELARQMLGMEENAFHLKYQTDAAFSAAIKMIMRVLMEIGPKR